MAPANKPPHLVAKSELGYTLLEILLVLFITVTIVGSFSVFSFKFIEFHNDDELIYQIQAKIKEAQFVSWTNMSPHVLSMRHDNAFAIYSYRVYEWRHAQFLPEHIYLDIRHADDTKQNESPYFDYDMSISNETIITFKNRRMKEVYKLHEGKGRITREYTTR